MVMCGSQGIVYRCTVGYVPDQTDQPLERHPSTYPVQGGADALHPHPQTVWSWHLTYKGKVRALGKPLQLGSRRRKAK
jgi:hypothetical protein